ncbi:MAG: hypothetical protein NUV65_03245 [Candidatus Roizmanbacteria bacterium]|nr:hypothetical protein [Candidatus Roizmanbacteria bacterium]
MKHLELYLDKYRSAQPLWGVLRSTLAEYLSKTTGETVLKNQITISGKKIYLRGVSTTLRSYLAIHSMEINSFLKTLPDAEHLHL